MMSNKVVSLFAMGQPVHDTASMLAVVDSLREAVESGKVVMFCAVGVEQNDNTLMWSANSAGKSQLQLLGAISHLQHSVLHGVESEA